MTPDEISEHIKALDQWLEQLGRDTKKSSGLSVEERKQLQTVNKAIEQLLRNNVPVPEDLRNFKLKLSARDVTDSENRKNDTRLKSVERLILTLGRTIKTARAIRNRLKATGQVGGPKKYYGITLLDLRQAGLLVCFRQACTNLKS